MVSTFDKTLSLDYKNMIGLSNIIVDNLNNTYINNSVSINSNLFISNNTLLINPIRLNSNLNISNNSILNSPTTLNSSLNISGNTIINNSTINNTLYISANTYINNNLIVSGTIIQSGITTNVSQLNVGGTAIFQNGINTNNITSILPTLNINADTINIGNSNSIININGTSYYVASTETLIVDKIISLNVNTTTLQGADIGTLSGIEILGISSSGFIRTSNNASRFEIKPPLQNSSINYITTQDLNNNLLISGTSTLINSTFINSSLNISSNSIINGDTTINNILNINDKTILNNSCTINSLLNINNLTIINNNLSVNNSLNISNSTILNNNVSMNSLLNINNNSIINANITINNSLYNNSISIHNNNTSFNSSINISGLAIINGNMSINSSLNISNTTNIIDNLNINSNLFVSGITILNNNMSIKSNLNVFDKAIFNNFITLNSNLQLLSQIITKLPSYDYNNEAKIAGVPVWGFYRTGGILRIRLNDTPPLLYLSGASTININIGTSYIDSGAYAYDYNNNLLPVYMSINSNEENIISNILISGTSTLIPQINSLPVGNYTATYTATDDGDLFSLNYRLLNINAIVPISVNPIVSGFISDSQTNGCVYCIRYNNNNSTFYAFAQNTNITNTNQNTLKYYSSTNALNWTYNNYLVNNFQYTSGLIKCQFLDGEYNSTYGNNIMLVSVEYTLSSKYNVIYKSTNNGISWTELPNFNKLNCILCPKFINNVFFISATYSNNTTELYYSTDTIIWNIVFTSVSGIYKDIFNCNFANKMIYGNNTFVLNCDSKNSNYNWSFIKSNDGINWTLSTIPSSIINNTNAPNDYSLMGSMVFGNNMFVITNNSTYSSNKSFILNSNNLNDWNLVELPYINNNKTNYVNSTGTINGYINELNIYYLYGNFINIHDYKNDNITYLCTSIDGINWIYNTSKMYNTLSNSASIANDKLYIPTTTNNNPYYVI